jgi:hypothetical protein
MGKTHKEKRQSQEEVKDGKKKEGKTYDEKLKCVGVVKSDKEIWANLQSGDG